MDFVESHFQQEVQKFRRLLRDQRHHLTVAGVHDLRVCTRRLRAQLRLIDKNSQSHLSRRGERTLKKLGDSLGERRQWDVLLKEAHRFHLDAAKIHKDHTRASLQLQRTLRGAAVQELSEELKRFERTLKNVKISIGTKYFKALRSQLKDGLKLKKYSTRDLHRLRISTKKIRYAFESLDLPTEDLKDLQDHLGKSHDLAVLRQYFGDAEEVRKADRKERRKATQRIRPALSTSLEVLNLLR